MTNDNKQEPTSVGNGWRIKERKGGFSKKTVSPEQQPTAARTRPAAQTRPAKAKPRPANVQRQPNFVYETKKLPSFSYRHVVLALVGLAILITTSFLLWGGDDEKEALASLAPATPSDLEIIARIEQDIALKELTLDQLKIDEPPVATNLDRDRDPKTTPGMGGPLDDQPIPASLSSRPAIEVAVIKPSLRPELVPQQATSPVYRVQVGALPTKAGADRLWNLSRLDHNELFAGIEPHVEAATTANGPIYRLQLGAFQDRGAANDLCIELTKRKASCFVVIR